MPRLLLLSNSRNPGHGYLQHARDALHRVLGDCHRVLFVPYAGVTITWDEYTRRVQEPFAELGLAVDALHHSDDPVAAIERAEAIVVGGGNTFHLLREVAMGELLAPIRARVEEGMPYVGWSAGANLACPTIRTTNDMPIVEPPGLGALGLVPFQINPHYTDAAIPNHGGETRPERIAEFLVANPTVPVVGLPEGTWLEVDDDVIELHGGRAVLFRHGRPPRPLADGEPMDALLEDEAPRADDRVHGT
jgi:dipeptidase E